MSRTYRNIEHAYYWRRPKTQNYRSILHHSKKEIQDVLGSSYLMGSNNKDYKSISNAWDDKKIAAKSEVLDYHDYVIRMFESKLLDLYQTNELPKWFRMKFNKNRIEIIKSYFCKQNSKKGAIYIPFYFKHKKYEYPVILYAHN